MPNKVIVAYHASRKASSNSIMVRQSLYSQQESQASKPRDTANGGKY